MRGTILTIIIGGFVAGATGAFAQGITASEIDVSNDPVVAAAYAVNASPSGVSYRDKDFNPATKEWFDGDLATANTVFASSPYKERSYTWRGRREGFLGNYAKAIEIFTEGMELFPESYALYRYRGYFLIRNYQFEAGMSDLKRAEQLIEAADVAPKQDGIPGKSNFSPSTFKRNIYYYIAEGSMATGDYESVVAYMDKAVEANELRDEDDFLVSTSYYKYLALKKLGRDAEADELIKSVPRGLNIIKNREYYESIRFLQGNLNRTNVVRRAGDLGQYTVGMADLFDGKTEEARDVFETLTNNHHKGYWLAEVELLNLR